MQTVRLRHAGRQAAVATHVHARVCTLPLKAHPFQAVAAGSSLLLMRVYVLHMCDMAFVVLRPRSNPLVNIQPGRAFIITFPCEHLRTHAHACSDARPLACIGAPFCSACLAHPMPSHALRPPRVPSCTAPTTRAFLHRTHHACLLAPHPPRVSSCTAPTTRVFLHHTHHACLLAPHPPRVSSCTHHACLLACSLQPRSLHPPRMSSCTLC